MHSSTAQRCNAMNTRDSGINVDKHMLLHQPGRPRCHVHTRASPSNDRQSTATSQSPRPQAPLAGQSKEHCSCWRNNSSTQDQKLHIRHAQHDSHTAGTSSQVRSRTRKATQPRHLISKTPHTGSLQCKQPRTPPRETPHEQHNCGDKKAGNPPTAWHAIPALVRATDPGTLADHTSTQTATDSSQATPLLGRPRPHPHRSTAQHMNDNMLLDHRE